jgi:hypothetical protein
MRTLLLACTTALILIGCQSSEEKIMARYQGWAGACGYPDPDAIVPREDEDRLRSCMLALEQSYQAERARKVQQGAAMLGLGSALMTNPTPVQTPPTPRLPMNCTTTSPTTGVVTTRCY